jgi:hypothetical protein
MIGMRLSYRKIFIADVADNAEGVLKNPRYPRMAFPTMVGWDVDQKIRLPRILNFASQWTVSQKTC